MHITIETGKTLLVDGPASVTLVSGKAEVFGYVLKQMSRVVIRDGKRMPFAVKENATLEVSLGENATVEEVEGDTVPPSWEEAYKKLATLQTRPTIALVLGAVDSGKTSFCTYLMNKLVMEGRKVAILDGDLGQSDVGPPCTLSYSVTTKPLTDLFNLEAENAYFVGVTSPGKALDKVIEGMTLLKDEVLKRSPDYVVVNTDGWVEGEDAVNYKVQLVEKIRPHIVFCIQNETLNPLLEALKNFTTLTIDYPQTIKQRNREKRKSLRELGYVKYLKNAKVQSIPISWVRIENTEFAGLNKTLGMTKREREICNFLGIKPLHIAELKNKIFVVIGKGRWINPEKIKETEETLGKKVEVLWKGGEEGLLTALYSDEKKFLGIGVLREIDYTRKVMKIFTPVSSGVSTVVIGKVRLDKNLREIPLAGG
ncbi:MAG: Clp1/GlmU family protein [Candidatus Bathyarchaeota archaeon]|nr:Clp1/GlmU family protein [Candidatus Bathyarchaeota archaeon]